MESTDGAGHSADHRRKDSNPTTTTTEDPVLTPETNSISTETEAKKTRKSKQVVKVAGAKKGGHVKRKTGRKSKLLVTLDSDSAASDDEVDDSSESENDSTASDSDGGDEDGVSKESRVSKKSIKVKKGKAKVKVKAKGSKIKHAKKNSKKNAPKPESDTDSDSSLSEDSDAADDDDDKNDGESGANTSQPELNKQFKTLQLQMAQLQQQLMRSPGYPQYPSGGLAYHPPPGYPTLNTGNLSALATAAQPGVDALLASLANTGTAGVGRGRGRRNPGLDVLDGLYGSKSKTGQENDGSKKTKKASNFEFKRVDWIWDNTIHNYKLQDTAEAANKSEYDKYIFHVRRTFDWEGKYRATLVDIKSKLLRECLQDVIGNVNGISLVDETPKVDPNLLFLFALGSHADFTLTRYLEDLHKHLKSLKDAAPAGDTSKEIKKNKVRLETKRKQLKLLLKYVDHDYAKTKESLYPMLENGLITFDLLWALWKPSTLAYTTTYGSTADPRVFKVDMAQQHSSIVKGKFYYIDGKYFEFDGKKFGYGNVAEEVQEFQGARKITSLACYPLKYHKNEKQLRADLIERGKKFVSLGGVHYKSYHGMAFLKRKKNQIMKFNVQLSRVMVDPAIFRRINANYSVSSVKPKDHDIISEDGMSDSSEDECGCNDSDSDDEKKIKFVTKVFKDKKGRTCMTRIPKDEVDDETPTEQLDSLPVKKDSEAKENEQTNDDETEEAEKDTVPVFTDEEYLIASPVVLGFAFSEKQWLEFTVSGVKDIKWNEKAWDSLVLEDGTKDLIKALVESRKYHAAATIDDVIQGKGKGLVTVLHGPPGTGKTLTAEGISELLKCPLYMASAGELGTDSRFLETELQKILDICHTWGAILLLDEADVFLEKRNMHDIHRNALVSIFLRQLEYFQGILFLTTNRVETFDEAFQSRIHIALRYDNLDAKAKRTIFKMFLDKVRALGKIEVQPLTENDLVALSKQDLNGREIKNVVGSAQDLAVNKGEALSMRHIQQVLNVHAKFGRDLKGGTGYEDAMRSYF
ncbi:Fc.00g085300.m01.CDS01 [Cosmosporella sp. VM-42]